MGQVGWGLGGDTFSHWPLVVCQARPHQAHDRLRDLLQEGRSETYAVICRAPIGFSPLTHLQNATEMSSNHGRCRLCSSERGLQPFADMALSYIHAGVRERQLRSALHGLLPAEDVSNLKAACAATDTRLRNWSFLATKSVSLFTCRHAVVSPVICQAKTVGTFHNDGNHRHFSTFMLDTNNSSHERQDM